MSGSKWYLVYFALAGFDLITILLSLVLFHNLLQIHTATVEENRNWAARLTQISRASEEASKVNVAANDVFRTQDVGSAEAFIEKSEKRFRQTLQALTSAINQDIGPKQQRSFLNYLQSAAEEMRNQREQANEMFEQFLSGDTETASRTMAKMDRHNALLGSALANAREEAESIQAASFEARERTATRLKTMEYILFVFVAVMVCGAVIYGSRLARAANAAFEIIESKHELESMRAQRMSEVAQLATGVAHELRNPLTSVKLLVQTGARKGLDSDDLNIVADQIQRMERSLNSFLNYARPPELSKCEFELQKLIQETVQLIRVRADQQNVKITVNGPESLHIRADRDQIQQLLLNLFQNALDVMPQGGNLTITCASNSSCKLTTINVVDSGPGITHQVKPRLFQPFVTNKETGAGLGLVISRQIARRHGGDLVNCENSQDSGACFEATITNG